MSEDEQRIRVRRCDIREIVIRNESVMLIDHEGNAAAQVTHPDHPGAGLALDLRPDCLVEEIT